MSGLILGQERLETALERDGFVVVPSVLDGAEIQLLRRQVDAHFRRTWFECDCGKVQPNGAVDGPRLDWLFTHPGVLRAVRDAMGRDEIVFTGNCDLHRNKLGNWHKDMGRVYGGFFQGDVFESRECAVYKVGLYLENHASRTGFRVRRGSHRTSSLTEGVPQHVPTHAGDLIIFDVRLTHAGLLPDPVERLVWRAGRWLSNEQREHRFGRLATHAWRKVRARPPRRAIFFTYGAANAFTEDFARNVARFLREAGVVEQDTRLSSALRRELARQGVASYDFG